MKKVYLPAAIAAIIGPIQSISGWAIAGSLWVGYDPMVKTISDLAANDSPVKWIMDSFFTLGGTLLLITAWYAKTLGLPGRVAIFVAGICTYGLTYFATPSQTGYSTPHRIFAIISFILMSAWPLLSIRRDRSYPLVLRPISGILASAAFTVLSVWFLSTWTDPNATTTGLWERVLAVLQVAYLCVVVLICYRASNREPLAQKPE